MNRPFDFADFANRSAAGGVSARGKMRGYDNSTMQFRNVPPQNSLLQAIRGARAGRPSLV
jgi:hypothetical protein